METPYFEKLVNFPSMHVEMGWICPIWPSMPLATKWAPTCKKPCRLAVPLVQDWKIANFLKKNSLFFRLFRPTGVLFLRSLRCWPYFAAGVLINGFSRTRKAEFSLGLTETPYFEKIGWFMAYMAIFTGTGPYSVMQSGASPGSSVGNTSDWILFIWSVAVNFCVCFRWATSHPVQNTQKHRFWPKIPLFGP